MLMDKEFIDEYLKIPDIKHGKIYHYTSAEGLRGILNGELWITDSEFLNDKMEFKLGNEVFYEIIRKHISDKNALKRIYRAFKKEMAIPMGKSNYAFDDRCFVLSCSTACDSMLMWSEYSGFIGYCMEFNIADFRKQFDERFTFRGKVVYKREEQIGILTDYIENVMFSDDFDERCAGSWDELAKCDDSTLDFFITNVGVACFLCNMFFKNECFEQEQEYRFVIYGVGKRINNTSEIITDFRVKNETIIPFIRMPITNDLGLKRVIVGPINHSDISVKGVKALCGFKNISAKVVNSEVPIRYS